MLPRKTHGSHPSINNDRSLYLRYRVIDTNFGCNAIKRVCSRLYYRDCYNAKASGIMFAMITFGSKWIWVKELHNINSAKMVRSLSLGTRTCLAFFPKIWCNQPILSRILCWFQICNRFFSTTNNKPPRWLNRQLSILTYIIPSDAGLLTVAGACTIIPCAISIAPACTMTLRTGSAAWGCVMSTAHIFIRFRAWSWFACCND